MSKIEVNAVEPQCGTTLTLGGSGDTVTLACGASQSGFGRTGTVDWQTGDIKTTGFTAATGKGYFCNTTGGAFTCTLPAGAAGSIVSLQDYANTFDTYALTITPDGSEKINGGAGSIGLATEGEGLTLVYIDSTQGWRSVQDNDTASAGSNFVAACGGNTTITCGDYKTHIFTGPGTLTVTAAGSPAGSDSVEYLVVAGGGGGGGNGPPGPSSGSSGAGGGGWRSRSALPTVAPTNAPANLGVTATAYPITVGGGGNGGPNDSSGDQGSNSIFHSITSAGGGSGAHGEAGGDGGSGGGGTRDGLFAEGSGNTPVVSPVQGYDGGAGVPGSFGASGGGGGGGQVGQVGTGGSAPAETGGTGGAGAYLSDPFIGPTAPSYGTPGPVGSTRYFAGGGGAGVWTSGGTVGPGGAGGGGAGVYINSPPQTAAAATINTGGGGGGGHVGGAGGSGIVMIRYKFQ
jgi:hypothetical protein